MVRSPTMSFGRNPHVAKAEAEEQKALCAKDAAGTERAWREAARQWDRAAERETDAKRRQEYTGKAEAARVNADSPGDASAADDATASTPSKLLN